MTLNELEKLGGRYENFVPPSIAAPFLGCGQYSLNVSARQAQQKNLSNIGGIRYYFAGRNLRLNKADIINICRRA